MTLMVRKSVEKDQYILVLLGRGIEQLHVCATMARYRDMLILGWLLIQSAAAMSTFNTTKVRILTQESGPAQRSS
jgi:hypothetical protein